MKLLTLILIIFFSLIIISCSDKTNPSSTDYPNISVRVNPEDFVKHIIGTWESGTITITFDDKDNFTKTCDHINPPILISVVTQKGKYEIVDSILILKTSEWLFSNPDAIKDISIIPVYDKIDFINYKMVLSQVRVFSKDDNTTNQLAGVWKMIHWVYHKSTTSENIEYIGRQEESYSFTNDDSVLYSYKYLDGNPFPTTNFKVSYKYQPPLINIDVSGIENDTVKFMNGKMYWFRKFSNLYSRTK